MLTVAMITRNEEGAVKKVIQDIKNVVPDAEILIVDSSDDKTAEIAEENGARVIKQFPAKGYGPAMDAALKSAGGDVVVTLDCDDTYPTDRIPELAKYVTSGEYDLVDASRLEKKPKTMPMINFLGNWGLAWIASIVFFRRFTDLHSGMRAYSKKMLDDLDYEATGLALPVELLLLPARLKKRIKIVYIDYADRIGDTKMIQPIGGTWWTLRRIFKSRFYSKK